jgi:glycosyltransferase involved in cell wall biosynthesis
MHWLPSSALSQSELDGIDPRPDHALSDSPSLVYIGRLAPEKNIPHLIQAMSLLKEQGYRPLPRLTLVGGGPQREQLEALVRELGCADIVSFAGQLDRRDLSMQLSQADLCVHASAAEGSPKAWLDAMAHGLPVLACEVPGARWTIGADGERGWLAPQGDVGAFAAALRRILTEPCDWPGLRRRARAYVESRTLEAWREQIGEICVRQWGMSLKDGKLSAKRPESGRDEKRQSGQGESSTSLLAAAHQGKAE